jgi:hypothetical protein
MAGMARVTDRALKERARRILVAMTERARWIYAVPPAGTLERIAAILEEEGMTRTGQAASGRAWRYESDAGARAVALEHDTLDVVLLEGAGAAVVPAMKRVLDATGFVPQSKLWGAALDIGAPGAPRALAVLAHLCVTWDEDWSDLFLLQLASPDPLVRHQAAVSLVLAALVAHDAEPALDLLREARRREKLPKLGETIDDAMRVLRAFAGQPLALDEIDAAVPAVPDSP